MRTRSSGTRLKVSAKQFDRVIESAKNQQTSVLEAKILLKQQGLVEEDDDRRRLRLQNERDQKAMKVIRDWDTEFDSRLNQISVKDRNLEKRKKEAVKEQNEAISERIHQQTERNAENRARYKKSQASKLERTLQLQRDFDSQNERSAIRAADEALARSNGKLEKFLSERRKVRQESRAFWYNGFKRWKENTVCHPSTGRTGAKSPPLTARSALAKELQDQGIQREREASTAKKNGFALPAYLQQHYEQLESRTGQSPKEGKPKFLVGRSQTPAARASYERYQKLWSRPSTEGGIGSLPLNTPDRLSQCHQERMSGQEMKEKKRQQYSKMLANEESSSLSELRTQRESHRAEVDVRFISRKAALHEDKERSLCSTVDRTVAASRLRQARRQAAVLEGERRERMQNQASNRSRSQFDERLASRESDEQVRLQHLASRLARRTTMQN